MSHRTKKQHFVPQFLLRNFATDSGKIWGYDKTNSRVFSCDVADAACAGYFYDDDEIDSATGKQFVETAFSKAEGRWHACLDRVLRRVRTRGLRFQLHHHERVTLSEMIALQMARTPGKREDHDQFAAAMVRALRRRGVTDDQLEKMAIPKDPAEWKTKKFHIRSLLDGKQIGEFQKIFFGHIWCFFRSASFGDFYISDDPVARRPHKKSDWRSFAGIGSEGIEIAVPLSHEITLGMFDRQTFFWMRAFDGRCQDFTQSENLLYHNSLQVQSSHRFVYSRQSDFSVAEMVCNEEPELRNPRRKSVVVDGDDDYYPPSFTDEDPDASAAGPLV